MPPTATAPDPALRTTSRTFGHRLEHDRLEQRALRVRRVIEALRERADGRDEVPRPLRAAIEDFGRELTEIEHQLRRARARR